MEVWLQEHKDGFLGIIITIAVSFITAILAVAVAERLRGHSTETPKIIYEVDPRSLSQ